jgi:hypothetical protein
MSTPPQNRKPSLLRILRVLFVFIGIPLLLMGAMFPILNALGVVPLSGTWYSDLGLTFAILAVVIALCEWFIPFSPHTSRSIYKLGKLRKLFRRNIESLLDKSNKRGAIIVYTTDHQVAHEINLVTHVLWVQSLRVQGQLSEVRAEVVKRHRVNADHVCAAVFHDLEPDDYIIWNDPSRPIPVPVFPNEATTINWQ